MSRTRKKQKTRTQSEGVKLPVKCPKCNEIGLVLLYDYGAHEMNLLCEIREDTEGRFIESCHEIVFRHPLTEDEFHALCHQPLIRENYFVLESFLNT